MVRGVNEKMIHKQMSGPWAMMGVLKTMKQGVQQRPARGLLDAGDWVRPVCGGDI